MDDRNGQEYREATRETLSTDGQPAGLLLKPGKGPFGLELRQVNLEGSVACFLGLPESFRDLGPAASGAKLPAEIFSIIPLIGRDDFRTVPGASTLARPPADHLQRRPDSGPRVAMGGCWAAREGRTGDVREDVEEDPLALTTKGRALTAAKSTDRSTEPGGSNEEA